MVLVRATGAPPIAYAALVPAFAALAAVFRATAQTEPPSLSRARTATRVAATGAVVALGGSFAWHVAEGRLLASFGCAAATLAGLVALGRVRSEEGLVARLGITSESSAAKAIAALGWLGSSALAFADVFTPEKLAGLPNDVAALAVSATALGSAGATLATGLIELRRRRLELGAVDRLRAFVTLASAFVAIAVLAGALRLVPLAPLFVSAALATSLVANAVSVTRSPETVGRLATQLAVLGMLAVLPAIVLAAVAKHTTQYAALAVFAAASLAALGGMVAPALARVLLPRTEPWTLAFEAAAKAALHPDPEPALERALFELRGLSTRKLEAPSLFRFDPPTMTTVDLAGYARTEEVTIPESFAEIADGEAERVVTRETLEAASVRRPDVRSLLAWLDDRKLRAVAVIREDDIAVGMLGLPRGERRTPLTLAEVRAVGHLARLLGAQIAASAKLARSRLREQSATERATSAERSRGVLSDDLATERRRGEAVCRILASRARTAMYSPAARLAIDSLESHGRQGNTLTVIAPPGVDPLPFIAVFHLASERKSSALYVVDGRNQELANLELWRSPTDSPLVEAQGGTLALVDPHLLPRLVQAYIAAAFEESRTAERAKRATLAIVVPRTLDALAARGVIDERFADAIGDRALALPPLAARAEDLRALVLDRLTKLGLDRFGRPIGMEPAALAMLAEHDWPGNDVELDALLVRVATMLEDGDVVKKRDLVRAGWTATREPRTLLRHD